MVALKIRNPIWLPVLAVIILTQSTLFGQLSMDFNPPAIDTLIESNSVCSFCNINVNTLLSNASTEEGQYSWKLTFIEIPNEWNLSVSDHILDYAPGIVQNQVDITIFPFEVNHWFGLHFYPNDIEGCGQVLAQFHDVTSNDLLGEVQFKVEYGVESCLSSAIDSKSDITFEVFPNPATDVIKIDHNPNLTHCIIFDTYGKKHIAQINSNNEISVEHLPAGLYFLSAFFNEAEFPPLTSRFIKE